MLLILYSHRKGKIFPFCKSRKTLTNRSEREILSEKSNKLTILFIPVKNLVGGRTYYFRVLANSATSYESSEEVKFPVPARVKHKAITAGVVGGILFFIVAIILSVCAVKICNKRKRRKQEKGECVLRGPVACPLPRATCVTL